jgi:hypothetical protein
MRGSAGISVNQNTAIIAEKAAAKIARPIIVIIAGFLQAIISIDQPPDRFQVRLIDVLCSIKVPNVK